MGVKAEMKMVTTEKVVVEMDRATASILLEITRTIVGPEDGPRARMTKLGNALRCAGVSAAGIFASFHGGGLLIEER